MNKGKNWQAASYRDNISVVISSNLLFREVVIGKLADKWLMHILSVPIYLGG